MSFEIQSPSARWHPRTTQESASANRFIAPGSETEGEFGLFDGVLGPGEGAVPHYHLGFSESFYLTAGELRIRVGDETRTISAGDFVYIPRRGVHVFRNDADVDARFLMLFVPGVAREGYFRDLAEAFADGGQPTSAELDAIARRHDQTNLREGRWQLD